MAFARTSVLPKAILVGALLGQILFLRANIAAADHARPARSRGSLKLQRSTGASLMKARSRSTSLAASRTAARLEAIPHRPMISSSRPSRVRRPIACFSASAQGGLRTSRAAWGRPGDRAIAAIPLRA